MLNILVASKAPHAPGGLEHLDVPYALHTSSIAGWAAASNALLDHAAALGGDALFLDDDTALTAGCLDSVRAHYDQADLFGLDLHDLSGARQAGARHVLTVEGAIVDWVEAGPAYVAHVSTSAVYLTARTIQSGLRFPVWPGVHWEDVAFCFDAWARGFRVAAAPGRVDHAIDGGVGATKRHDPAFWERWALNRQHFAGWCAARNLSKVPIGAHPL